MQQQKSHANTNRHNHNINCTQTFLIWSRNIDVLNDDNYEWKQPSDKICFFSVDNFASKLRAVTIQNSIQQQHSMCIDIWVY
jgi:hypothetical protein